jgi:hypothetical protein
MLMRVFEFIRKSRTSNACAGGKKPVHRVEPMFNDGTTKLRVFLEDGSLGEYAIGDLTTAEVSSPSFQTIEPLEFFFTT